MTHFHELFEYHQNTKHSYFSVRSNPNRIDWNNPPNRFKTYSLDYKRIDLNKENQNSKFLYLIAGITAKKTYPNMEYYLRVNPSAGALYPNEIYFQVRNEDGFEDGIYHYEVSSSSVTLLKKLSLNEGIEANLGLDYSYDGFMFFISSLYFRSSWKYKNRAFRYCLLDAGHIIGSIEFSSYLFNKEFEIIYDFNKEEINKIFNFDNKEFFTSIVISGNKNQNEKQPLTLDIQTIDGTSYEEGNISFFEINNIIEQAYKDSTKIIQKTKQKDKSNYVFNKDLLQDTIFKRRSIREFSNQSISKVQFESIMNILNQPIASDCDEVVDIYYVINRVQGMPLGLYKDGVCIKEGDLKEKAGYLCLEQDLGKSSAVTFFLASKSSNYQESYQKAGIIGHRLYISSNYLNIGCSGIGAYYDDEVCELIGENSMILYALAIGN